MIRFGSRGSDLALTQTRFVAEELRRLAGADYSIEVIRTRGDDNLHDPLPQLGGKGLFTTELEAALRQDRIDVAVHSLKDLPVEAPDGLTNGAIPARESVHDVLVFDPAARDPEGGTVPLRSRSVIGTSSPRRGSSVLALRSDLTIEDIRGNVETRAGKVAAGGFDATILAAAGLRRLGLSTPTLERVDLPVESFTPAPGQGALGVQCRAGDDATLRALEFIHDPVTAVCVNAERQLLFLLGGGCSMPLGALVQPNGDGFRLLVSLFSELQPSRGVRLELAGVDPAALATAAAEQLRPLLDSPLAGQRVVLLRPGGAGGQLGQTLGLAGADVETVTVSEILPIDVTGAFHPTIPAAVAFTSARAVDRFFEEVAVQGLDIRHACFFAVGPATANAIRERGHDCESPNSCAGGRGLAALMTDRLAAGRTADRSVLFPCAENRHPDFEDDMAAAFEVSAVPIYRTLPLSGVEIPTADHLVFTSPSAVQAFTESSNTQPASDYLAFGEATASAMNRAGIPPRAVSTAPTAQALVSLIRGLTDDPTAKTAPNRGDS